MRCAAITRAGGRCRLEATRGSYCYSHSPETAAERARHASRGGKAGGNGRAGVSELGELKREIRAVIGAVLSEKVDRGVGTVAFQVFNSLLKAVEIARKIKETEDLEARLEALEAASGERKGGRRTWGA
ncbi:MAG: hypothetical protein M3Q60_21810 [Actinomycetota bacterium]|nr:hypothetical protein [Actinomycetota bacterium]